MASRNRRHQTVHPIMDINDKQISLFAGISNIGEFQLSLVGNSILKNLHSLPYQHLIFTFIFSQITGELREINMLFSDKK